MKILTKHEKTPFLTALEEYANSNVGPFDVPGHHMGNIDNDFFKLMGSHLFKMDVNAPRGLDTLSQPEEVIKEAAELIADLYDAEYAYFLVNGTSSGIIAMMMATTKAHEKIIVPRNIHKSVISGLVLSGAIPVFVHPEIDNYLGISNNTTFETYKDAILKNPDAKTVFIINPTYFGVTSDIQQICDFAHEKNMTVIVDEAHGAHFHFHEKLPMSAMVAGADMSACSFHKTCGSLTQSSVLLLQGSRISPYIVQKTLNILQTTSPSALLIASCDASRKHLALHGEDDLSYTLYLAENLRRDINAILGFEAVSKDYFIKNGEFNYDETKIVIRTHGIDLTGFELYQLLKDQYNIQMELGEVCVVLAVLTIGTTRAHCESLVEVLTDISIQYYDKDIPGKTYDFDFEYPNNLIRPRVAFHAAQKRVHIDDAVGEICAESIIAYPPGIPLIIPGEEVNQKLINRVKYLRKYKTKILSDYSDLSINIIDKEKWGKAEDYE